jgi:hypothetical protein
MSPRSTGQPAELPERIFPAAQNNHNLLNANTYKYGVKDFRFHKSCRFLGGNTLPEGRNDRFHLDQTCQQKSG